MTYLPVVQSVKPSTVSTQDITAHYKIKFIIYLHIRTSITLVRTENERHAPILYVCIHSHTHTPIV